MPGFFAKLSTYYHTVRYLRSEQIFYRIYYPVKRLVCIPRERGYDLRIPDFAAGFQVPVSRRSRACFFPETNGFCFLGQRIDFGDHIDWVCPEAGRLWRFHLYYFDWLLDDKLSQSDRLGSMIQFIDNQKNKLDYNHAYPTALRMRNWICFLLQYGIKDARIEQSLYRDALLLYRFPEYDIGGNHLLESGLALLWSGHYFSKRRILKKGENILLRELDRQILADGSHYERSIGYHTFVQINIFQTILFLEHLNKYDFILKKLKINFFRMLSYLKLLEGSDRIVPHFGDSNPEMMLWTEEMDAVAQVLPDKMSVLPNADTSPIGLKLMQRGAFRLFFMRGQVLSPEQPGHSHADTFSFCLNVNGLPCIVDPGVSVYESGARREAERSTMMHNTLLAGAQNSSELWASFRMARRAEIVTVSEDDFYIDSEHNGYYNAFKMYHRRAIRMEFDRVTISDECRTDACSLPELRLMLHFHPDRRPVFQNGVILLEDCGCIIQVEGADIVLEEYEYCQGFGVLSKAIKMNALANSNKTITLIKGING